MEKIYLTRNMKNWRDFLSTEVQLRFPDIAGRLWTSLGGTDFIRTLLHEFSYLFKLKVAGQIQVAHKINSKQYCTWGQKFNVLCGSNWRDSGLASNNIHTR
jgi:hypothetical protein